MATLPAVALCAAAVVAAAAVPAAGRAAGWAAGRPAAPEISVPAKTVFTSLTPTRICDTRAGNPSGLSGPAAQCNAHGPIGAAGNLTISVASWVPSGARAAVLDVTAIRPSASGFLVVLPAAPSAAPKVSSVNFSAGVGAVANAVIVPLSSGSFDVYNAMGSTNVAVDLMGYFAGPTTQTEAGEYFPLPAYRVADTRCGASPPPSFCLAYQTVPPANIKLATIPPGGSIHVLVAGTGNGGADSVPSSGVAAVAINLTAVAPTAPGYFSAWATGARPPAPTSVVNFSAGQTLPNRVIVPVPSSGDITVFNGAKGGAGALVDVDGWFADATSTAPGGSLFLPASPTRICDTRAGNPSGLTGGAAQCNSHGPVAGGTSLAVQVGGNASVPTGASAVVANVTALDATQPTYATVTPVVGSRPTVSDLNPVPGQVEANMDLADLSTTSGVEVYNNAGSIDVAVDVYGYLCPAGSTTLAGYETSLSGKATATFTVPKATCSIAASTSILVGVSLWDRGGNDIGAVVKVACSPVSTSATYAAQGFFFNQPKGSVTISPLAVLVLPGNTVVTTVSSASPATATVTNVTTGMTASASYTAVGGGPAFVGMFCSTNWNAPTPCTTSPAFPGGVGFSKVFVDGTTALGKVTPPATASSLVGPGCAWSITPTPLDPTGTAFDDVYR